VSGAQCRHGTGFASEADGAAVSQGKHHSWVELYFDLVFVFAVGQLTHLIVAHPAWGTVALALALFVMLWWTWIGFVVHYNRHGEDRPAERLILIAGTVPCAIAAIEVYHAQAGHLATFALALAGARLVLALAYLSVTGDGRRKAREIGLAYVAAAGLLAVSAALPPVWQYAVWAVTLVWESTVVLSGARSTGLAVDAGHMAQRFNLFMIIMLGEVVISVSAAATSVPSHETGYWLGLFAGLILAGALWWIYFDSAAEINAILLHTSGGHPAQAYAIYAMGYLLPAFAVLVLAAGCGLALQLSPPRNATWYVTLGLAGYLIGIRGFEVGRHGRRWHLIQVVVLALTISIALLNRVFAGPLVVAVAAVWAVAVAAAMSRRRPEPVQTP
jgi:low temperature requirement protein LtrA